MNTLASLDLTHWIDCGQQQQQEKKLLERKRAEIRLAKQTVNSLNERNLKWNCVECLIYSAIRNRLSVSTHSFGSLNITVRKKRTRWNLKRKKRYTHKSREYGRVAWVFLRVCACACACECTFFKYEIRFNTKIHWL